METTVASSVFEVGKVYQGRFISDWDSKFTFRVVERTAKFVTLLELDSTLAVRSWSKTVRVGVYVWAGVECCRPMGRYSMNPILSSEREVVAA